MNNDNFTSKTIDQIDSLKSESFFPDLWHDIRPYTLAIIKDFLIAVMLWSSLWLFKQVTSIMPIEGWAGEFIVNIHAAGTVFSLALFISLLLYDIVRIHRAKGVRRD